MSGGVDSSVAAALLLQQGYQVIGMMLRLWAEPGREHENRCCTPDSMALARRVAARLEIPFYTLDAQSVFYNTVVKSFIEGYQQGDTPNPCLRCNRLVRWDFLFNHARAAGGHFFATGHYARLRRSDDQTFQLLQAVDLQKDQSYVLHVLQQNQLEASLFPLGEYTKAQVRQMAREFDLPVAEKKDSQDLCFLGQEDYRSFLARHDPTLQKPGSILNINGDIIGEHQGLAFYTLGQRKGLGISARNPSYVIKKDTQRNTLIVGEAHHLGQNELTAQNVNWISGSPPSGPIRLEVKIRYKANPVWGWVTPMGKDQAMVKFDSNLRDITPGQAAVFYDGQVCLGGGIIIQNDSRQKK
jgi:tRNA-specific 2-thiouridylase